MRFLGLYLMLCLSAVGCLAQAYQEWIDKAMSYTEQDSLQQAVDCYGEAVKLLPPNHTKALLYTNIGSLYRRMEQLDKSIDAYSQALELDIKNVSALLSRASVYMMQNHQNNAYLDYCQVLDINHDQPDALLMRAYIYLNRHDYGAARIDYLRLLDYDPQHYAGRLGLIELDRREGRMQSALSQLNLLIVEHPTDPVLLITRAGIESDMHHWELALADLTEALRLQPNSTDALLARGEAYLQLKQPVLARQEFEKAIRLGVPVRQLKEQLQRCK